MMENVIQRWKMVTPKETILKLNMHINRRETETLKETINPITTHTQSDLYEKEIHFLHSFPLMLGSCLCRNGCAESDNISYHVMSCLTVAYSVSAV